MEIDSSIYAVKMFKERGYIRQKCSKCGEYFWSLRKRDDCGDAPCSDYTFFNLKLGTGPLTVKEARDRFLNFFKRKGHEVIDPAPVVARWRDDLYLTIASIIVFQPHVTSGIVPPPANPLVIAQPCIRLEDLDSVGYTFGRHLTSFIMGGHHAFNYPEKEVYFTHRTVELAMKFFTKEIGIPEDELVFKESWWEGGGNAGPSFEVAVGGLELATLVFMMYDVKDGKYVEMPIKIVDTGYGIERIAWFTQKTPTSFHAIYGDVVRKYHDLLGLEEPPEDVLRSVVSFIGKINPKDPAKYRELVRLVAQSTGISEGELGGMLDSAITVYALLDHVKTASLMLADGIVPSNTGEGYLARLVIRRIMRMLASLEKMGVLHELFDLQARYWRDLYPQITDSTSYIQDVLDVEAGKYRELLRKAPTLVRKYIRAGGEGLSIEELIQLYDSHGIPPELAADIARDMDVEVTVPQDFYAHVASKHSTAPIKKVKKVNLPKEVVDAVKELPPTRRLFHEDPYIKEFEAEVQKVVRGKYLVLDKTVFYPEGGGQIFDTGYIITPSRGRYKVVNVQKVNGVIVHELQKEIIEVSPGETVKGVIDWERRYVVMRHHTATHIILGAARKVLGEHVWQAGAEKTPKRARLDITHHKPLTKDEIRAIEDLANKVVLEGRPVRTQVLPKYEAEKKYGFRLYEGGVILEPEVRVVEIEGLDAEACFGTHLTNTREVGAIKIVDVDRIADGVVRLEYVAGTQVAEYARELEERIGEASQILGGEVVSRAKSLVKELESLRKEVKEYRKRFVDTVLEDMERKCREFKGLKLLIYGIDELMAPQANDLLLKLTEKEGRCVAVALIPRKAGTQVEISLGKEALKHLNAGSLMKAIASKLGGSGGGKPNHASGFIKKPLTQQLLKEVESAVEEALSSMMKGQ